MVERTSVYKWKNGYRAGVKAQIAGEVCEKLDKSGGLTSARLVDASRPEDAPLHGCFEWDDSIAGEKFRRHQAGTLISSLTVTVNTADGVEKKTRGFVHIKLEDDSKYEPLEAVLEDIDKKEYMLECARKDAKTFVGKYETLKELSDVISAMNDFIG